MRTLPVAFVGQYDGYERTLIPALLGRVAGGLRIVPLERASLVIFGPFSDWVPGHHRVLMRLRRALLGQPVTLYHTGENTRPPLDRVDFAISFDFGLPSDRHLRWPFWMQEIDWDVPGLNYVAAERFGSSPPRIEQLMSPLGAAVLSRRSRAAIFTSHWNHPRKKIVDAVSRLVPVDVFGPVADASIANHNSSGFKKADALSRYMFNVCPENASFPGYVTEKIPEAFCSGCIPVTWAHPLIETDFNPAAIVNLGQSVESEDSLERAAARICDRSYLSALAEQPLLLKRPSIEPLIAFLEKVVAACR